VLEFTESPRGKLLGKYSVIREDNNNNNDSGTNNDKSNNMVSWNGAIVATVLS
jgi:hypothetical protein